MQPTQHLIDTAIPFDGIIAFNDQLAMDALFTLAASTITVPDSVQVIGLTISRKPHTSNRR